MRKTNLLKDYAAYEFPKMAGRKALRFIDGNFRAQGWQGAGFKPWKRSKKKGGATLVKKGKLRRSFRQQYGPGQVRIYTQSPYAAIHNRGFNGRVNVKGHQRRKFAKSKVGTGRFTKTGKERTKTISQQTGTSTVAAFKRKVVLPKRQFMPESYSDSPVLFNAVKRDVERTLKSIFG